MGLDSIANQKKDPFEAHNSKSFDTTALNFAIDIEESVKNDKFYVGTHLINLPTRVRFTPRHVVGKILFYKQSRFLRYLKLMNF